MLFGKQEQAAWEPTILHREFRPHGDGTQGSVSIVSVTVLSIRSE